LKTNNPLQKQGLLESLSYFHAEQIEFFL